MSGQRGEKPAGRGKAVPRDMQDQQASPPPDEGPEGPPAGRGRGSAKASGERRGTTGERPEDEPPD
ncbi:hypothetical protein ACSNOH_04100 [Streptomyces sp. URMC 127]|uniref:hypothetical protein n=1 Tax=Streptomyces sp. URMC 127 TaxID=3423402 RepID=UPI003F1E1E12